jgi:acetyltransferase-like isoleucine patch superfamily enzyme
MERRGARYDRFSLVRGELAKLRIDEAGALRVGRGFFVSHQPGSRVVFGESVRLYERVRLNMDAPGAVVSIGSGTFLNTGTQFFCRQRITIGENCAVAGDVTIMDNDGHELDGTRRCQPVTIGDRVWIGQGATILAGVNIGDGAVVAARAVVTHDIPAGRLARGLPAKDYRAVMWSA